MFNETSYSFGYAGGLGDAIVTGQALYWAGTVADVAGDWNRALADFESKVAGEGFAARFEANKDSSSLAANITAPGDFADSNDIKAILDGIANESGFRLRASMITPGARPLSTPAAAGDPFAVAGDFWGSEIGKASSSVLKGLTGADPGGMSTLLVVGGLAVLALFLLKR
jgi:hypothetical protein